MSQSPPFSFGTMAGDASYINFSCVNIDMDAANFGYLCYAPNIPISPSVSNSPRGCLDPEEWSANSGRSPCTLLLTPEALIHNQVTGKQVTPSH